MPAVEVLCLWDDEAKVWYVSESGVPGLVAEAPTREAMDALLRKRVPELIELNMPELKRPGSESLLPIELVYRDARKLSIAY